MLTRKRGYLLPRDGDAPAASRQLEAEGWAILPAAFDAAAITALKEELEAVYRSYPPDGRSSVRSADEDEDFRYEACNRSALAQRAIANPAILEVIEPLLGEDCHVIANTCWRNPAAAPRSHGGGFWHIDAGPHIPRDPAIEWDERIPYPIFAVGAHIYLQDCPLACGPTGVIPGSHKSGQPPPHGRLDDASLSWKGREPVALTARSGDVALFVSDVWHRRLPAGPGDAGRFFLQAHYGRRDIAQRLRPTVQVNHLSEAALRRIESGRERRLLGLHENFFYDG
jgi:ectoine hydroxylase-related dioxygenase (phytanoyl-CoA dioxygenase family)